MSAYQTLNFTITGLAALLMHNGQTADPLNPHSKIIAELTSKRKKTEADHIEIGRREFLAGLYLMNGEPCIPSDVIEAMLIKGAMKEKRGPQAKAGLLVENHARLNYEGPRTPNGLWEDERFRHRCAARVNQSKIMRTRPMFRQWSADLTISYLPSMLNPSSVRNFLVTSGEQIGIGDWRPRYGRFAVQ